MTEAETWSNEDSVAFFRDVRGMIERAVVTHRLVDGSTWQSTFAPDLDPPPRYQIHIDTQGRLLECIDRQRRLTCYQRDSTGRIAAVIRIDAGGNTLGQWAFTYLGDRIQTIMVAQGGILEPETFPTWQGLALVLPDPDHSSIRVIIPAPDIPLNDVPPFP